MAAAVGFRFLLLLLSFCLFAFESLASRDVLVHPEDATALFESFSSIVHSKVSLSCSQYSGVHCDSHGRVISIDFTGYGLTGTLPAAIFKLGYLQTLKLARNNFVGSIPESLGNLKSLVTLELFGNHLTGNLPNALGKLPSLQYLNLAGNKLTGSIPGSILGSSNLVSIDISSNTLNGVLPNTLAGLHHLVNLDLHYNRLKSFIPQNIAKLKKLQTLDLSYNLLGGNIPPLTGMSRLQKIVLRSNYLSGAIPSSLGNLGSLSTLDFSSNRLSGSIPSSIGSITNLRTLKLNKNSLSGAIPSSIGYLHWLQFLDLSDNSLRGPIPPTVGSLGNLLSFNAARNKIVGGLPSQLGYATRLVELDLSTNFLTGGIPPSFNNLRSIQSLYLQVNRLSGTIPGSLGNYRDLVYLDLSSNKLSGSFPGLFRSSDSLQAINLAYNSFTGPFPVEFNNFFLLQSFDLHSNAFTGPVVGGPALTLLEHLDVSSNYFGDSTFFCSAVLTRIGDYNLNQNCLAASPCAPAQRSAAACNAQCNPHQPRGSCGGFGTCISNKCRCYTSYSQAGKQGHTCVLRSTAGAVKYTPIGLTLKLSPLPRLSSYFRFLSSPNYAFGTLFGVVPSINWAQLLPNWYIPNYNTYCAPSWAQAPLAAISAAESIYYQGQPPLYSLQQVVSCVLKGDNCAAGSPLDTLEYAAYKRLESGTVKSCAAVPNGGTISHFEAVRFAGLTGIVLALQRQPVLVQISAGCKAVYKYRGGIFGSSACDGQAVDHTVVIVGYNFSSSPPYWLLRNTWGPNWGENGYMRLALSGGNGHLNINSLPGYIPIIKKAGDACNTYSLASTGTLPPNVGVVNPCGNYPCSARGNQYTCACSDSYEPIGDPVAGGLVCVLATPCAYFPSNPCVYGTCVNGHIGNYLCLCPLGYVRGKLAINNLDTCVPGNTPSVYVVPAGFSVTCSQVIQAFGLSQKVFSARNPHVNCGSLNNSIGAHSRLVLSAKHPVSCSVWYSSLWNDNCNTVKSTFHLKRLPIPDVDCNGFYLGQQICVQAGAPPARSMCTNYVNLQTDYWGNVYQNGTQVIQAYFGGNQGRFFSLNPGFNQANIFTPLSALHFATLQLCMSSVSGSTITSHCGKRKAFTVASGQTCQYIYKTVFKGSIAAFAAANSGALCNDDRLYVGQRFCA